MTINQRRKRHLSYRPSWRSRPSFGRATCSPPLRVGAMLADLEWCAEFEAYSRQVGGPRVTIRLESAGRRLWRLVYTMVEP